MKLELESHPGLIIENPEIEIISVVDDMKANTIAINIIFKTVNINVHHELPSVPYEDNAWNDADVELVVANYLNDIKLD